MTGRPVHVSSVTFGAYPRADVLMLAIKTAGKALQADPDAHDLMMDFDSVGNAVDAHDHAVSITITVTHP